LIIAMVILRGVNVGTLVLAALARHRHRARGSSRADTDGFVWVAAFNGRPENRSAFRRELEPGLRAATNKVKQWPDGDLFGRRPWKEEE
jgi:hypothetical protein